MYPVDPYQFSITLIGHERRDEKGKFTVVTGNPRVSNFMLYIMCN